MNITSVKYLKVTTPIGGEEIMKYFHLKPCKEIGIIKEFIKNSILDGKIENNYKSARSLMIKKGIEMGLKKKKLEYH